MKHPAISAALCLLCLRGVLAQAEEKVTWSAQEVETPPVAFHRFVGRTDPSAETDAVARWIGWDEGKRLNGESSSDLLHVAVLHPPRTWTLVLWNDSDQKTKVTIEGELPAGVYTTERLMLASGGEIVGIERRNGLLQRINGRVRRLEWLDAHSGLVLRFVERLQTVDETLHALRRSVWQSKVSRGVLSRLAALLREADSHWYQARASLRKGNVSMGARGIHRMLFLSSGIQVVSSKYVGLEEVTKQAEFLIDSLSELSSALLNIVIGAKYRGQQLGIQVVNAGAQVWKALRLVPEATDDVAVVLAEIKPMERAEASFRVPEGQPAPDIVVSVLFNGGYARLKLSCGITMPGRREEQR